MPLRRLFRTNPPLILGILMLIVRAGRDHGAGAQGGCRAALTMRSEHQRHELAASYSSVCVGVLRERGSVSSSAELG